MAYAKHIIQRQLIELEMGKEIDQLAVQNKVSGIYRQQIVPLLDELFSQVSRSSAISIDRLELDLGNIPVNELEQVLAQKISLALQEKLAQVAMPSETNLPLSDELVLPQQKESHTDAELLTYFLQTGLFPWWAQENTYTYLQETIKAVLLRKDASFKKMLAQLLQTEEVVKRLIYTFPEDVLEQLVKLYTTVDLKSFSSQKEMLLAVFIRRLSLQQLRVLWWVEVFQTVNSFPVYSEKELFEKVGWQFVKQVAQQEAWPQLQQWYNRNESKLELLKSIADFIRSDNEMQTDELKQQQGTKEEEPDEKKAIENRGEITPDTATDSLLKSVEFNTEKDSSNETPNSIEKQIAKSNNRRQQQAEKIETTPEARPPQQVTDVDKLYIQNAGLVLLWPFLHRFFQQLELADEKTFLAKGNAERAGLLLQYLVTGHAEEMFEAQLPLNKMLCGIPLLQPIDTQWNITKEETAEAENLLLSVIENAGTAWKNLSVNGLRQAYLQRDGILSSRDGAWLLQVERKPYDILLERLPWTVSIVKLPWMKGLVFVEW